ncbi:hypothetical protein HN873_049822, partial [Arachis hypogaea]
MATTKDSPAEEDTDAVRRKGLTAANDGEGLSSNSKKLSSDDEQSWANGLQRRRLWFFLESGLISEFLNG